MINIKYSNHFIVFCNALSKNLISDLSIKMPNSEIIPIKSGVFPAGSEFLEFFPLDNKNYKQNAKKLSNSLVTIIQSLGKPCAENLMHACQAIDNARTNGAKFINIILTYAEYTRQDRSEFDRFFSVTNPLIAKFLAVSGANHVTVITPHSNQSIKQYKDVFDSNFEYINLDKMIINDIKAKFLLNNIKNLTIGAPDGANKLHDQASSRAETIAKAIFGQNFHQHLFRVHKKRISSEKSEINEKNLHYKIKNKICIIIDDIIDSGETMINAARYLKKNGASTIHCYAMHGVLSRSLHTILEEQDNQKKFMIESITLTDTLPIEEQIKIMFSYFPETRNRVKILKTADIIALSINKIIQLY